MLIRPNKLKQSDQIVHGFSTHMQSRVHWLPTTKDTDTSTFNTSRIFNNFIATACHHTFIHIQYNIQHSLYSITFIPGFHARPIVMGKHQSCESHWSWEGFEYAGQIYYNTCTHTNTHIHVHTHTHTLSFFTHTSHTRIHLHTLHIHTFMHIYRYMYTHIQTHIHTCIYMYTHTHININADAYMYHTDTYTHTLFTNTHIHTYSQIQVHTHTHTHILYCTVLYS